MVEIKETILKDVLRNLKKPNSVSFLRYEKIDKNIDEIIDVIKDEEKLKSIIKKDKDIWLIYKRLGFLDCGEIQSYEDIYINFDGNIKKRYNISLGLGFKDVISELNRKFCTHIKNINSKIEKGNCVSNIRHYDLQQQIDILKEQNEILRNQNTEYFCECVLEKTKRLLKK